MKKPKAGPKPETECLYCKANGHWKRNCPKYLADKKDGKVNKGIFDIHVTNVYFTSVHSSPGYLISVQLLRLLTRNKSCRMNRLVKSEVKMCVGNDSKVDTITIAHSLPLGLVLNLT